MILGEKIPKKQKVSVLNDAAGAIEEKFNEIQNGLDAIGEAMKPFLEVCTVGSFQFLFLMWPTTILSPESRLPWLDI